MGRRTQHATKPTPPQLAARYLPGQSGNPSGRPKGVKNKVTRKLSEQLDPHVASAIATLAKIAKSKRLLYTATKDVVAACETILAYRFGRPKPMEDAPGAPGALDLFAVVAASQSVASAMVARRVDAYRREQEQDITPRAGDAQGASGQEAPAEVVVAPAQLSRVPPNGHERGSNGTSRNS